MALLLLIGSAISGREIETGSIQRAFSLHGTAPLFASVHVQSFRGALAVPHDVPPAVRFQKGFPAGQALAKGELNQRRKAR